MPFFSLNCCLTSKTTEPAALPTAVMLKALNKKGSNPPSNNPIIKGKWWKSDQSDNLQLSLDHKVATDLKLKIGDSLTFNIYGNSVTGVITNFRKVDYKDLNINFAISLILFNDLTL